MKLFAMTKEEIIATHYSAAMDSVNLLHNGKPEGMADEEWLDRVQRNRDHLDIMLAKDFWTTYRQALRDIPQTFENIWVVQFPEKV